MPVNLESSLTVEGWVAPAWGDSAFAAAASLLP
jgi:hypothetical protein